ncbi:hypothetical protein PR003_g29731 [Phytophthora rubi]|uniref:Integrase catalytic domain-containing protein n=1 Tax=Phytophthora rubi TaxID=129364 RepID=A0A6A4BKS9_9STRA|nr:hypothetical protein PR002_g28610 [Phytophthora rubi]KAE9274019.1 hypothetical protein PR003_g29731 [Phytophthora rubi]
MVNNNLANGVELANKKITFCMACAEGKQSRNAQPSQDTSDSAPTDELGTVLCMDLKVDLKPDRNGNRYVLTIVDHASNYNKGFLLPTKDETFDKLQMSSSGSTTSRSRPYVPMAGESS